jgi:tRNA (cmo5U34)-methyltransferase
MILSHHRLSRSAADAALSADEARRSADEARREARRRVERFEWHLPAIAQNKAAMTIRDFPFAERAGDFDQHIGSSIPGYQRLRDDLCVGLSRNFIQNGTTVVDVGCSTGALLWSIREANQVARPSVRYIGIDAVPAFGAHWRKRSADNVEFQVRDARLFDFENVSLACSIFTLQFIPERDRPGLLRRLYDGLNEGGALIIAEKILASSAYFQDVLTFNYYDFKLRSFSTEEIFDKQRSLRGQMISWDEARWEDTLRGVGFQVQRFWQDGPFVAWLAKKSTSMAAVMRSRRPLLSPRRRDLLRSGMPFVLGHEGAG